MSLFIAASRVATTSRCMLPRQPAACASSSPLDSVATLISALPSESRHFSKKARRVGLSKEQRRKGQLQKQANLEKKSLKAELLALTKPNPVLGYCPGNTREAGVNDEALWEACELRQVILSKDEVWGVKVDRRGNLLPVDTPRAQGTQAELEVAEKLGGPTRLNFGLTTEDRTLLFKDLPEVTAEDRIVHSSMVFNQGGGLNQSMGVSQSSADEMAMIERQEGVSSDRLARILDLRNASGKGIDVENKKRILQHFGTHERDVGSVEAQAALMTYRLHLLHDHLSQQRFRKDNTTRRNMTLLVHKRAKLLKYLKRTEPKRYDALLPRIGVHPRAVEGELIVPSRPKLTAEAL